MSSAAASASSEHSEGRYEFRCWRSDTTVQRRKLHSEFAGDGIEERIDIYLLSDKKSDLLPKLRGREELEVKRRLACNNGLEFWEIAIKQRFPVSKAVIWRILETLGEGEREVCSLPDARAAIEYFSPFMKVYCVPKLRRLYRKGSCRAEATRALINLNPYETVAFEGADQAEINAHVAEFGLSGIDNIHYGRKLRDCGAAV